ncbi:MAG: carboxypeptidase-like regulatory domain-containing protein, partial [Bacteroidota bacterium]
MKYILTFAISFLFFAVDLHAQTATVYGSVTDAANRKGVELVTVFVKETNTVAETNRRGRFEIDVPSGQVFNLLFTRVGYSEITREIQALDEGERLQISITLDNLSSDLEVIVQERKIEDAGAVREDVEELKLLPTTTGNLESVLPSIALGTSSGTGGELSSQYNVRGGNYDENLVYVNDFEVYRPQLIRAGQQEGLTFPNIDLVRDLSFSSGGFEAKYGDKLSSVLDIAYKRPDSLRASVGMSFLGGSAHIEGSFDVGEDDYKKLRYLVGARYKTTRYLLGSLDVQGEYTPNFADVQAYITYDLSRDLQLGILANYNYSEYNFTPRERNTAFGLINFALNLSSVFEGQERDDFTTGTGGVSLTYIPDRDRNPIFLKLLASRFQTSENERFDIIGRYSLAQIETGLGSDNFGEVTAELGAGTQQEFVRNYLFSTVTNVQHKGGIEWQLDRGDWDTESSHFLQWSVKFQNELVEDELNEWERLDSA